MIYWVILKDTREPIAWSESRTYLQDLLMHCKQAGAKFEIVTKIGGAKNGR